MSAPEPSSPICPSCASTATMVTGDGNGLCFDCRHEWDPANVVALSRPATVHADASTVDDVLRPPDDVADLAHPTSAVPAAHTWGVDDVADDETAQARLDAMVGGHAVLEGGQVAMVAGFPDADHVDVILADGRGERVPFSDVERIMPPVPANDAAGAGPDDAWVEAFAGGVTSLAGLIVKAAVAGLADGPDGRHLTQPPTDFLPTEPEMFPIVEQAAVHAVATVLIMSDVDLAALVAAIDHYETQRQGDQTTEVTQ